jgi:hypothetical protein
MMEIQTQGGELAQATAMDRLQAELSKLPQYIPETEHFFHGGMYCRKVSRKKDTVVVGAVHKHEHFYLVLHGTVVICDGSPADGGEVLEAPALVLSRPGTRRAVVAVTDAVCMTFHRTDATTVEDAERDLVQEDPASMFTIGNQLKQGGAP